MTAPEPIIFPLIPYVLLLICTFCAVNLYLGFKRNKRELFGQVINAFLIYMFIHALSVWVVECFFLPQAWIDRMFPFVLFYGPFYYFAIKAAVGKRLSTRNVLVHAIPFLCFFMAFLVYVSQGWYADKTSYLFFKSYLGTASLISLSSYCFYGFFTAKINLTGKLNDKRTVVLLCGIVLLFVTMFFFAVFASRGIIFENVQAIYLLRLTVYSCLLVVAMLIFGYQTEPFLSLQSDKPDTLLEPLNHKVAMPKYEKSILSELQLNTYELILNDMVSQKALFLNQELSLHDLALELKIPAHHLTQLLNTRLKTNFHSYINHLRVLYACTLLSNVAYADMPLEELGSLSGFNSKVSFNRHFKFWMNCTPSEYRKALK